MDLAIFLDIPPKPFPVEVIFVNYLASLPIRSVAYTDWMAGDISVVLGRENDGRGGYSSILVHTFPPAAIPSHLTDKIGTGTACL